MGKECTTGRVTIPTDVDVVPETLELVKRWGADAIRDCDGTDYPEELKKVDAKVYATYYTTRKDNVWAKANPDEIQQMYIMTSFHTATKGELSIHLMDHLYPDMLKVNSHDDIQRWWEVIDRTTGKVVPVTEWSYSEETGDVTIKPAKAFHDYTVSFLAYIMWDPVHCPWCSNPESQRREPERAYNPTRCLTAAVCGRCAKACPTRAVSIVGGLVCFDRSKCTGCNACVRACPSGAQTVYGETQSVDQILSRVEEDGVFYTRSGGGLTLSGGEALAQPDFALALLREAKKRHIHTTIETCGHYPTEVLDQACRVLDALIFDIKCLDSARHKKATGVGSELILKNIGHVFEHFPDLPVLIRTPVIPGFNDTEEDILGIREMIPRKANIRYEALTYHRMGQPKYGYLGRRYELEGVKADEAFMKRLNIMLKSYEK